MKTQTQFVEAANQAEAQYAHGCDKGKWPYAIVEVISLDETRIVCPLCGHTEIWPSTNLPSRKRS